MPNETPFAVQADVRGPWRTYLDRLEPLRPQLHRYCCRLTGNVWDGEDLVQDALLRVFGLLGKIDADLENPRAYLIRTATHLWIDRQRRAARDRAYADEARHASESSSPNAADGPSEARDAARALLSSLGPKERAAIALKDVFDLSLEETASALQTTVGAVKSALHRARGKLQMTQDTDQTAYRPSRACVERFMTALATRDITAMKALCLEDVSVELVGGAQMDGFDESKMFFEHAHMVLPELGFGENPNWRLADYMGEPIVLGLRTLGGVEGLNEIHRIEEEDGKIARIRCYCFAPDTLRAVAADLNIRALDRAYRSP